MKVMRYYSVVYLENDGTEDSISVKANSLGKALQKVGKWFPNLEPIDIIDHGEIDSKVTSNEKSNDN